ncbi:MULTISPECIES: hypothetical protein [Acinetobacter]|uniref:Uncharacterized protein n=1 Tax=Acinetobacter corruptisaponis TaxID=3045147 RepID=A0ABY8S4S0_9GAMM|nr:hypothetical protein [Acinetobacter sp. KCTC 92772]WHP06336.1 hypothetical protein QLH32_02380 [Acinetobacter sp. KCTC 92772]
MISTAEIVVKTIGKESFYVLEKSGTAIHKESGIDTNFAKGLLQTYKEQLQTLEEKVISSQIIDHTNLEYEFKTSYYAIDKLLSLLGNINSESNTLEAMIFQSHIRHQDEHIRLAIEEVLAE